MVQHVFLVHRAATAGVELMTVHALEHDALAVELHHAVFDGEMPDPLWINGNGQTPQTKY